MRDGVPDVNHLPLLARRDADGLLLEGHWSRANPQSRAAAGTDATAIFHGPTAYLSAGWYPDKREQARVPTWNYVVAHLRGTLERYDDTGALGDLVARTADRFEPTVGGDWRYDHADPRERDQLRGIVGFRLRVTSVDFKRKLSQNHPQANRAAVVEALSALPGDGPRAIAALMRAGLDTPPADD